MGYSVAYKSVPVYANSLASDMHLEQLFHGSFGPTENDIPGSQRGGGTPGSKHIVPGNVFLCDADVFHTVASIKASTRGEKVEPQSY